MPIEKVELLSRARYGVDLAVHELHAQLLAPVFIDSRKSEQWCSLFFRFPSLRGEKAFLREVNTFRAILPSAAQAVLDSEISKVKAAYVVAYRLKQAHAAGKNKRR
jgi:hypothetical protein